MHWTLLLLAGLLEVCWVIGMKKSAGFSDLRWNTFTLLTLVASMYLLAQALRHLPVGTAYAVWTGIGAVGAALLGIVLFGEPRTTARLFFITLILIGIVGLRFATPDP